MRIGIASHETRIVATLRRTLADRPQHQLVWIASDGAHAIAQCTRDTPDLILMDLEMPGIDGVEATRSIMTSSPCAILLVTRSVEGHTAAVFDAMGYGAMDAVDVPLMENQPLDEPLLSLLQKIDTLAKLIGTRRFIPTAGQLTDTWVVGQRERLVAIGASAGGPMALSRLLAGLPRHFPAAIVIVQHVDQRFAAGMADWLARSAALPVRIASEGDRPTVGSALLASTNDHLVLKAHDRLGYTTEPRDQPYRPSVDVFFESVGATWRGEAVGVLLTGMGRDGAKGLKSLRNRGCYTIAQDEASSAVYGMPKAANTLGAAVDVLPLDRIAARLIDAFSH